MIAVGSRGKLGFLSSKDIRMNSKKKLLMIEKFVESTHVSFQPKSGLVVVVWSHVIRYFPNGKPTFFLFKIKRSW